MSIQEQSLFFEKLPPEIRLKIYKYVIDSAIGLYDREWIWDEGEKGDEIVPKDGLRFDGLQLLRASKKLFHESVAYANSTLQEVKCSSDWFDLVNGDNNVWQFFGRFPPVLCHRLMKVVMFASNLDVEQLPLSVNWQDSFSPKSHHFPNLRVVEVWKDVGRGFSMTQTSGFCDHVANLLLCPDGPQNFGVDHAFIQKTTFGPNFIHPQLADFFHTNNFIVHVKINLRVSVWEQYGGWPYRHGWRKIWIDDYFKHTLVWTEDHVALIDCPDMRQEHWYPEWVASPRYQREFDFLLDRDDIDMNTLFVICIDDATGEWGNDRHDRKCESWSDEDEGGRRVLHRFKMPRGSDKSCDTSIRDILVTGELSIQDSGLEEQTEVVYSRYG
ncbi:hypothetical protein LTR84_005458 [Exophiala bonariae]|uniref:HNH nuclease domain-containing protein n=1 Tax=Exophiala bonariae TaxID=1690606 RepID=A0AAV9N799_9EURO|nr:hypothetical protein LTR84_005458 [Exophiala bonariae]